MPRSVQGRRILALRRRQKRRAVTFIRSSAQPSERFLFQWVPVRSVSSPASETKPAERRRPTKNRPDDVKILRPERVNASDLPCHNPANQLVSSLARMLALPPYISMSRRYRLESLGAIGSTSPPVIS